MCIWLFLIYIFYLISVLKMFYIFLEGGGYNRIKERGVLYLLPHGHIYLIVDDWFSYHVQDQ